MPATIRISDRGHGILNRLAQDARLPMIQVLDAALESYRRQRFLEASAEAYAALRADPATSAEYDAELAAFDGTLNDGLEGLKP